MNKTLIVLMAVCLLSVHAFVKREAEKAEKTPLDDFTKQITDFVEKAQGQLKETFDSEKIKEQFNKVVDTVSKSLKGMEGNAEAPKS